MNRYSQLYSTTGSYRVMTIAPHHTEIHRLVDKLMPPEAEALYVLLKSTVGGRPDEPEQADTGAPAGRFSFAGIMHAGPGYAERSKDILRTELGRPDAP